VNSALQRARAAVSERLPERSQQATLRALGDDGLREVVERYVDAWERRDVEAVVAMLAEDAALAMPPLATWYRGREAIAAFLAGWPLSGAWRWRHLPAHANGQAAVACYAWDPGDGTYRAFALEVLALEGRRIKEICAFVTRSALVSDRGVYANWPEQPNEPAKVVAMFERFGLPDELT
jgi:RNA polymerase sigma-70 factor (ECF subfamily)